MVSNKGPNNSQVLSRVFDFTHGMAANERSMAASFRRDLIDWSLLQTRDNLVEWFSFEIERFIEHLDDSELGVSEAARELEMPRSIRREIEREVKKSKKKLAELIARLRKLQKDLPEKTKGKEF